MLTKRILALLAAGLMACTVLAGCTFAPQNGTESSSQTAQTEAYYTFTDALGKEVVLEERHRILLPDRTEPRPITPSPTLWAKRSCWKHSPSVWQC